MDMEPYRMVISDGCKRFCRRIGCSWSSRDSYDYIFHSNAFAVASGNSNLPNGLLFGGGFTAIQQFGLEMLGVITVAVVIFVIS